MMNSTERLQQIFKKPVKKVKVVPKVNDVTFSSEMVKDVLSLTQYPINDVRFFLKMESMNDEINTLSASIENLFDEYKIKGTVYSTLNSFSTEMGNFYLRSLEAPDVKAMAGQLKENISTLIRKIIGYLMGLVRKVTNWVKLKLSKTHLKTYMEYLNNKANFDWNKKIKPGKKLSGDSFKTINEYIEKTKRLENNSVIYQDTQNEKEQEYSGGIYKGKGEQLKNAFVKIEDEVSIKDAIGGENNIKFISKEFFNSINTLVAASKSLIKNGEKIAKDIKKEDIGSNPSKDEKNSAGMRYKNQVNMIRAHANEINALVSACITISGFVNSCIKQGLSKSSEEKPKEKKKEEKPTTEEKK